MRPDYFVRLKMKMADSLAGRILSLFQALFKVFMQRNFTPTFYGLSVKIT